MRDDLTGRAHTSYLFSGTFSRVWIGGDASADGGIFFWSREDDVTLDF